MSPDQLDALARVMPTAESKNAIHACRDGHPLGKGSQWKWRNALAAAQGIATPDRFQVSMELQALQRMAHQEERAAAQITQAQHDLVNAMDRQGRARTTAEWVSDAEDIERALDTLSAAGLDRDAERGKAVALVNERDARTL